MRNLHATSNQRAFWEHRAAEKQNSLSGVLFQGLPERINQAIHQWHVGIIEKHLLPLIPAGGRIMDLGCGYGRISQAISKSRPDLILIGTDVSFTYCALYGSLSICATMESLPIAKNSLDGIIAVTSLMYADPDRRSATIQCMIDTLRPGGHIILFDPGKLFQMVSGIIFPQRKKMGSGGSGITRRELRKLGETNESCVIRLSGSKHLTLALPLAMALQSMPRAQAAILNKALTLDLASHAGSPWDFHHWIMIAKRRS